MGDVIHYGDAYQKWLKEISVRYSSCRIKAAVSVNRELISFYWSLGKEIVEREAEKRYGNDFYNSLSRDLKKLIPDTKGFASSNLRYMAKFYSLYSTINFPQAVGNLIEDDLFSVPWGHHRLIMDRCGHDTSMAVFFVRKTIENNWSRVVLMNFLDTDLYTRQGKAVSNFESTLPPQQSAFVQEMTKDPYVFNFLTIQKDCKESQLKEALVNNVIKLLMEFGKGFSFVGKEYRIPIEGTDEYVDILFYHLWLHCYVVVEVKVTAFSSRDIGQTATYVAIVDDRVRRKEDNKSIGLIICKSKNNVLARYAVGTTNEPIGISEYELPRFLPSTKEIERELSNIEVLDKAEEEES
ncbi:MAG: DUF1016 family protein [Clostridiales bacterium]|nr:DUF1016 family protein [Clostridiales bacterium]